MAQGWRAWREWPASRRRMASLGVLGLAALVILAGFGTWLLAPAAAPGLGWVLAALLLPLLAIEALLLAPPRAGAQAAPAPAGSMAPERTTFLPASPAPAPDRPPALAVNEAPLPPGEDEGAPVLEEDVVHLRCGDCGTRFDLVDTGVRPLYHTCPGCGREGVMMLRDVPRGA